MSSLVRTMRTPRGQLTLLLLAYAFAAVVGAGVLGFRPWFAQWVRYKVKPSTLEAAKVERLAGDDEASAKEEFEKLPDADFSGLYGRWLNDPSMDGSGRLGNRLLAAKPNLILRLVRDTFVAGSRTQVLRSASLLETAGGPQKEEAAALLRFAIRRAQRRGDADLRIPLESTLQRLVR